MTELFKNYDINILQNGKVKCLELFKESQHPRIIYKEEDFICIKTKNCFDYGEWIKSKIFIFKQIDKNKFELVAESEIPFRMHAKKLAREMSYHLQNMKNYKNK